VIKIDIVLINHLLIPDSSPMKKLLALSVLLTVATSCVIIRFPETMHVDVKVPEDFTQKDVEVIIDTLKNGKLEGVIQVKINKKSEDQ